MKIRITNLIKIKKLLTFTFVIFSSTVTLAVEDSTTIATKQEADIYHGELLVSDRAKAGLIIAKGAPSTKGLIVVKRNQDIILRLPVTIRENSLGLTLGVHFTGKTTSIF
ncbi:MAG: hypothetical protein L6Q37_17570, partial [Bdellovibrionaceae bacterium]|nr:hypothetical protein [Pseudobdellovibrionaceae bacterium]